MLGSTSNGYAVPVQLFAGLFSSITSGVISGASSILVPTADVLKSSATLAQDGLSIGQKVAHSGLDIGANVATGTATIAGTALGGVVTQAAETSGDVFEPVGSGMKAIVGLHKLGGLGRGVDAINGLPMGAIRQVTELTSKALTMSGKVRVTIH
jgi:hypothetical protein